MIGWLLTAGKFIGSLFVGGSLDGILKTIDKNMDNDVAKEEVKAEVTKKWIDRQADLLVGRTWWFQLFFVIPLGLWWTAVILDSILPGEWHIAALPDPLNEWAAWILSALFIVDGGKALLAKVLK
jgi:hypothetical protein